MNLHRFVCFASLLLLLAPPAFTQCSSSDSAEPCFATNYDILGGRQSVLNNDDIAVGSAFGQLHYPMQASVSLMVNSASAGFANAAPASVNATGNVVVVKGRLANLPTDQVVWAQGGMSPQLGQNASMLGFNNGYNTVTLPALSVLTGPLSLYGTAGQFTRNGFDQMVFAAQQMNSSVRQIALQALAAANPNLPSAGLTTGPSSAFTNASGVYAMTSGVFTDLQPDQAPPAAQVVLLSGSPANGLGLSLSLFNVGTNLAITQSGSTTAMNAPNVSLSLIAVAAGRFLGGTHDQIAVAWDNGGAVTLALYDFGSNGLTQVGSNFTVTSKTTASNNRGPAIFMQTGRFDWFSAAEQVVLSASTPTSTGIDQMEVISFQQGGPPVEGPVLTQTGSCHFGLATGRFDNLQPTSTNPTNPNPNFEVADLPTNCSIDSSPNGHPLNVYFVTPTGKTNPETFQLALNANRSLALVYGNGQPNITLPTSLGVSMAGADVEGRSLRLGPATKATVANHVQPDTVLGLPPMHVDYIAPAGAPSKVMNISVFPQTFNTTFNFASGEGGSLSHTGTTSYTAATKETVGAKVSYGIPGLGGFSVQNTEAFGQMHQNVVAKKYNTYAGSTFSLSTNTEFDDVLLATLSQMNIYSYRVLGHCSCKRGRPHPKDAPPAQCPCMCSFPDRITRNISKEPTAPTSSGISRCRSQGTSSRIQEI